MTDNSHLYSCDISNRPRGGFFSSRDIDGHLIGSFASVSNESSAQERSDRAHMLVKAAKCPTGHSKPGNGAEYQVISRKESPDDPNLYFDDGRIDLDTGEIVKRRDVDHQTSVVIERKDWANEYRIRTKCETTAGTIPPAQSGPRITNMLSLSGAQKIAESCRYVATDRGGYSTFLTLTFDADARERIANGATIQSEVSRFWDAASKIYKRGWTETVDGVTYSGESHSDALDYCWVAECPKNEDGEDNPHVHVLMRWRVPYRQFQGWAQRLQRVWGHGFAKLEKIREPEKSGAYIAKAAGYMTKGQAGDQGEVRGNRYGISSRARAPDWELVGTYSAGLMGSLISDVHDFFLFEYGDRLSKRERLKTLLEDTPKTDSKRRQKIGKALEKVRSELNDEKALPIRPSKYQLVMTGINTFRAFMNWAKDRVGASYAPWLPAKSRGVYWSEHEKPDGVWLREWRRQIWARRADRHKGACDEYWAAIRADGEPAWLNDENIEWCM